MAEQEYFTRLRKFEGFNPRPYGDYKQTSIGFGTRARPGETFISREDADRRLQEEVGHARGLVRGFGARLSPRQELALTDLTYNAGNKWMSSGLGSAVRAGDWSRAAGLYRQYNKAGGQTLPGLVNRREAMTPWLLDTTGAGEGTMAQPTYGMLRPLADRPAQPAAGGADPNALGAISPEHIKTLGAMGMLRPRNSGQPRNVGEALGQIGDMIYDRANTQYVLGELRKATAAENAAWSSYGGAGSPSSPGAGVVATPPQSPATDSPGVPGGMIAPGMRFGSNPSPAPAPDTSRPLIAGGMIAPGVSFSNGERVMSQDMAPPPVPIGMAGGGQRLIAEGTALMQQQAQPQGDPRAAWLDAQEARAQRGLGHPATREDARKELAGLRQLRWQTMDPAQALQRRSAELDIATKERELAQPKDQFQKLKEDESLFALNPRTRQYERIAGGEGSNEGGGKHFRDARGKKLAETYQTRMDEGDKGRVAAADIDRLGELSAMVGSGAWEAWKPTIGPWAESLGISTSGLNEATAFQAIVSKMAPQMRPPGSGATSDFEMRTFLAALPSLSQTPAGRQMVLSHVKALNDHRMAVGDIASEVMVGNLTPAEGERQIKALPRVRWQPKEQDTRRAMRREGLPAPAASSAAPQAASGPPPAAVALLRSQASDPSVVQQFEAKYGAGSARQYLQQQSEASERRRRWSQRGVSTADRLAPGY